MRNPSVEQIEYFAEKIAKRMKDFAVHNYKQPLAVRGRNCLDGFRKNSNQDWAQEFFMLALECWAAWVDVAKRRPELKGSKKILKNYESIQKNKVVLPDTLQRYAQYNMMEEERPPERQQPTNTADPQQGSRNQPAGRDSTNQAAQRGGRSSGGAKVDESKALKAANDMKKKITEVGSFLGPADEYADYMQDIIDDFDATYKQAASLFKPVVSNPDDYKAELVESVQSVVSAVDMIDTAFEKFATGAAEFDHFKQAILNAVSDLNKAGKKTTGAGQKPAQAQQINPEIATVPKKDDKPVTNIDMNSYMSAAMNKRIEEEEDEAEIQLPDHMYGEDGADDKPQKSTPKAARKNDDPFSGDFNGFEDGDEPFEYQPEAMNEVEVEDSKFNEDSKASVKLSDRKNHLNKSKADSKFKFQEVESDEERDQMSVNKVELNPKQKLGSLKLSHVSDSYQYSREDTPKPEKSRIEQPQSTKSLTKLNQKEPNNPTQEEISGFISGGQSRKASQQTPPTQQNPKAKTNLDIQPKGSPKLVTEEEKVKLAQKNQKALGDPTTQAAMADFFSGEQQEPESAADVFARAKLRSQQQKAKEQKKKNPSTTLKVNGDANEEAELSWASPKEPDWASPKEVPQVKQTAKPKVSSKEESGAELNVAKKSKNRPSNLSREEMASKAEEDQPVDEDFEWEAGQEAQDYFQTDDFFKAEDKKHNVDFATDFFGGQDDPKGRDRSHATERSGSRGNSRVQGNLGSDRKLNNTVSRASSRGFFRKPSEASRDIGEKELEEYLKQKKLERQHDQEITSKEGDESMAAKFRNIKGGLLEDGNDDYYAPPDIEKMKAEILRLQQEKEREPTQTVEQEAPKAQKIASTNKPAQPRKIDASNPPGYVMTALQREPIKNPVKPPISRGGDIHKGKQSQNESAIDVFQKSDFFNDFGSPVKLREAQSRFPVRANGQKGNREESFFDGDKSLPGLQRVNSGGSQNQANVSPAHVSTNQVYPKLTELHLENERLRRENEFLESEKNALDSKLSEVMTVTVKSLKTELQQSGSRSLTTKIKLLEGDLKMTISEKEMYAQKYKELYQKYRQEAEQSKEKCRTLFDPKKMLELSKMNTTLQSEKQVLEKQLGEEREKSRNHSQLREEFERTKAQLSSMVPGVNINGKANESNVSNVLRGLGGEKEANFEVYKPENGTFFLEEPAHGGANARLSRGSQSPKGSSLRNSHTVKDIGGAGAVSNVNPAEAIDAAKLDDSDLDFLGNFHRELDKALGTISGIDKNPYYFNTNKLQNQHGRSSSSLFNKNHNDKFYTAEKKKASDTHVSSYLKKPYYGQDPSDDQDLYRSVTLEEGGGYRSSSFCRDGKKNSARFGTTSNYMDNLVDNIGKHRTNFDSFNPRSYQNSQKIPALNIAHKTRFSNGGPEWFGYSKKNFAAPERGSTQSLLDPFNKLYDEIPLPSKGGQASFIRATGMPVKPISASKIDVSSHLPPKVTSFSVTSSHMRPAEEYGEPHRDSQERRTQEAKPAVSQRIDPREILEESPLNQLNFKACSVFNKGKLFIAKGAFEISCKSALARDGPKAEVSLELTVKSLRDGFKGEISFVQQSSNHIHYQDKYRCSSDLEGKVSLNKGETLVGIVKTSLTTADLAQHTLCHLEITTE